MLERGARNFVFIGRSGCDKPRARELVNLLKGAGASVTVVRGDVSNATDVAAAINACEISDRHIGGVVQAAMGLDEALFEGMTNKAWHKAIRPKWAGSWNLHKALDGHDQALDFFLLTSSISGSVGTATEANYCAANAFLDAFATWRRSQGKPTVSIGLGMITEVGYLHENPEIEALLLRKGIQPLTEDEFLQVVDMALSNIIMDDVSTQPGTLSAHILTGLEPFTLQKLTAQGFDVSAATVSAAAMRDTRTSILSANLESEMTRRGLWKSGGHPECSPSSAEWLRAISPSVKGAFISEQHALSLREAVLRLIRTRFSNLILTKLDQIDDFKPLAQFGMDSMIAAEFRTWFWTTFKVDIPFIDLLSPLKNINVLAEFVEATLRASEQRSTDQ